MRWSPKHQNVLHLHEQADVQKERRIKLQHDLDNAKNDHTAELARESRKRERAVLALAAERTLRKEVQGDLLREQEDSVAALRAQDEQLHSSNLRAHARAGEADGLERKLKASQNEPTRAETQPTWTQNPAVPGQ